MKTCDLFKNKTVLSFEIFPPKADNGDVGVIYKTLDGLSGMKPDFISVTLGAGGTADKSKSCDTIRLAADIKHKYGIESAAHLPGLYLSEERAEEILQSLKEKGIDNILALRGDIIGDINPNCSFAHAVDLISFIREKYGSDFNIIAACYPEGHIESGSIAEDIRHLKEKVNAGASQLVTQLFLDNEKFYRFMERTELADINVPIEAGIMPVTNAKQIERMVKLCGVSLPGKFIKIIEKYGHNPEALTAAGIAYAIDQIVDLTAHSVNGIHLYTMNNPYVAGKIYNAICNVIAA